MCLEMTQVECLASGSSLNEVVCIFYRQCFSEVEVFHVAKVPPGIVDIIVSV